MKKYKIAVAGTGYVGLSLSVLLAQHNQVVAVDIVQAKVDMINNRKSPIQDDYIEKYLAEKELNGEATRKMRTFLQGPKPELLHHQRFFENGTAERAKESGTEQNYNMIDGCVNNVPKKPRRIGGRWSVLDRLHIKQAERRQKDNTLQQEQERSRKN